MKFQFPLLIKFIKNWFYLLFSLYFYLLSIIVCLIDKEFNLRWFVFIFWVLAIALVIKQFYKGSLFKNLKLDLSFVFVLFIALLFSFSFIWNYPFHSISDELRDGGLDTMVIVNGEKKNIFAYGRYESHGLIIPTIAAPFYMIFGNSFSYKIPATLISIADVILIYFLCKRFFNRKMAFFASVILTCIPLHLYYARTELVVIFSSFLCTLLTFLFLSCVKNKDIKYLAFLGLGLGFASGFHASIRSLVFVFLGLTLLILIYRFFIKKSYERKNIFIYLGTILLSILIGFGPRILFTTFDILFLKNKVSFLSEISSKRTFLSFLEDYPRSFMVYFYEPSYWHFRDATPILFFPLGIFFIIGLVYAFIKGNIYIRLIGFIAVILPLTNSAITDTINANHRMGPYLPIAAIICAYGIYVVSINIFKDKELYQKVVLKTYFVSIIILTIFMGIGFFARENASISMFRYDNKVYQDFMFASAIKYIQENKELKESQNICFEGTKSTRQFLEQTHMQEQLKFFLPNAQINISTKDTWINDNELYISNCSEVYNWNKKSYCLDKKMFECPPDNYPYFLYTN